MFNNTSNKAWDEICEDDDFNFGHNLTKSTGARAADLELIDAIADDPYIKIPRGEYQTQVIRWEYRQYKHYCSAKSKDKGRRIVLQHRIIHGEHQGVVLEQFFPRYDRFSKSTYYYEAYVLMNNGKCPAKSNRMSPKIFLNAICQVWVDCTKKKSLNGQLKHESLQYSEVKEILKVIQKNGGNKCES